MCHQNTLEDRNLPQIAHAGLFSPAFMDTLVHISSALQRSRTGLKLLGQLLADHRDELGWATSSRSAICIR